MMDNIKVSKAPTGSYKTEDGWQHISPQVAFDYIRMEALRKPFALMVDDYVGHPRDLTADDLLIFEQQLHEVLLVLENQKIVIAQELARVHMLEGGR